MKLLTFNVKLSTYVDEIIATIDSVMNGDQPDYICLQEYQPNKQLEKYLTEKGYRYSTFEYLFKERKQWHQNLLTAYRKDIDLLNTYTTILNESKLLGETKGVMIMEVNRDGQKEFVVNVHLPILRKDTVKFEDLIGFVNENTGSLNYPVYICGDFNSVRKKSHDMLVKLMEDSGFKNVCPSKETFSYLTNSEIRTERKHIDPILDKIKFKNDWIFANLKALENMSVYSQILHNALGSDHDPVYLELEKQAA
ncbi:MAG: hypothetical protein QY318_04560 [Candidatus Dojkabacteria bacterium]|nr:MAG: hypothetical protein QY318_04560 [Candidatus Dojkabacteria bacterium]